MREGKQKEPRNEARTMKMKVRSNLTLFCKGSHVDAERLQKEARSGGCMATVMKTQQRGHITGLHSHQGVGDGGLDKQHRLARQTQS